MRVLQIGLGSIGSAVSRLLVQKTGWHIVAAVDADPAKYGRDLGEVVGLAQPLGVTVRHDLSTLQDTDIDLAFLTTVSAFPAVLPTLSTLIHHGIDVVASTEELFYPYHRYAAQAVALDELAKQHGVSLLGTGINPGFVMDTLVLVLTGACQHISRLAVTRVTNASGARASLQTKLGLGLTPELFAVHAAQGQVGDFGLVDSLAFVAHILKWQIDDIKERLVPVIAEKSTRLGQAQVERGKVCGVRYTVKGMRHGKEAISFDLRTYLEAEHARDTIYIEGTPTLEVSLKSTDMGDVAAAGLLVNMSSLVRQARPGLLTMVDLPLPHWQR